MGFVNRGGSGVAGGRLQKKKLLPPINRGGLSCCHYGHNVITNGLKRVFSAVPVLRLDRVKLYAVQQALS